MNAEQRERIKCIMRIATEFSGITTTLEYKIKEIEKIIIAAHDKQPSGDNREPLTDNERFERIASLFYKETGMMAPGKDVGAAVGPTDHKKRHDTFYNEWQPKFIIRCIELFFANRDPGKVEAVIEAAEAVVNTANALGHAVLIQTYKDLEEALKGVE